MDSPIYISDLPQYLVSGTHESTMPRVTSEARGIKTREENFILRLCQLSLEVFLVEIQELLLWTLELVEV